MEFLPHSCTTTLAASDDTIYTVPTPLLLRTCGLFLRIFSLPSGNINTGPIPITAHSRIVTPVLSILACRPPPEGKSRWFANVDDLEEALDLAQLWDAPGLMYVLKEGITGWDIYTPPNDIPPLLLRLYSISHRMSWDSETAMFAKRLLEYDIFCEDYVGELKRVDALGVMRLERTRRLRRDVIVEELRRCIVEGASSGSALLTRALLELDRFPAGDSLLEALEMDEWSEGVYYFKETAALDGISKDGLCMALRRLLQALNA